MNLSALDALLTGACGSLTIMPDGVMQVDDPPEGAILSGAFNPLHHGHLGMARAATALSGLPVAFELAVLNADKGALAAATIRQRAAQFRGHATLILSRAPLFVQKAALYPGRSFVLGFDTAVRLLDPRYYGGPAERDAALTSLAAAGCRLLVAGRLAGACFATLSDLELPPHALGLFSAIPAELFREDISSSELRARRGPLPDLE